MDYPFMTVQAVCRDIQLTIGEPFNPEVILTKTGILDLGKGLISQFLLSSAQNASGCSMECW